MPNLVRSLTPLQHRRHTMAAFGCPPQAAGHLSDDKMADRIIQSADLTRCRKRATEVDFEVCLDHFSHMIATWSKYTVSHQHLTVLFLPAKALSRGCRDRSRGYASGHAVESLLPSVCCSTQVPPAAKPTRVAGTRGHCELHLTPCAAGSIHLQ